jgi:hypothetical protein
MSQTYKIHRWDSVLFKDKGINPLPTPIIYVKPEPELVKFAKDNSNAFLVKLHAPGSIYDQKRVTGVWAKSSIIPNCRSHFFENTELYVIVLQAPWHGYPDCLGDCEIFGLTGGVPAKIMQEVSLTKPDPVYSPIEKFTCSGGIPAEGIVGIIAAFLVLIIAVVFISKN